MSGSEPRSFDPAHDAEFDAFADSYTELHKHSIAASGEDPEYFARYKLGVLRRLTERQPARRILDFGCGVGALTRFLGELAPDVAGYDPSRRSIERARSAAPNARFFDEIDAIDREHFDLVVIANVLHHVPPSERDALLGSVVRCVARGGRLVVFEHNPWNPLTRRAVHACPFDENAVLLSPSELVERLERAKLTRVRRDFIVFFPHALRALRGLEPRLRALPIGAQMVGVGTRAR